MGAWISSDDPHPLTKKAHKYEKTSKEKIITWISQSWKSITPELAAKSFNIFKNIGVEDLE